jgi:hypothetical protein
MSVLMLAKRLNLDTAKIEQGEILKTSLTIKTPQEYKELFGAIGGPRPGLAHDKGLLLTEFDPLDSYQAGLKHFTSYVLGGVDVLDEAIGKEFFAKRFPMTIPVTLGKTITVTEDIVIPAGSTPQYVSCDDLVFDGGSYVVQNTTFTLWVTNLLTIKNGGKRPYHIGILGANGGHGHVGAAGVPQNPAPSGSNATPPSPGVCTGAGKGGNGSPGSGGYTGGVGGVGQDGLPSLWANINIAGFAPGQGPLVVFGMSGAGGDGGTGGAGGTGQHGGNGGHGCSAGCEGTDGGNGSNGGQGGQGGIGGQGGNAVNGGPVYLNLPANQQSETYLLYQTAQAKPGQGGTFGVGGAGGGGGTGGSGGHGSRKGTNGNTGTLGANGTPGMAGAQYGTPPQSYPGTYTPPTAR